MVSFRLIIPLLFLFAAIAWAGNAQEELLFGTDANPSETDTLTQADTTDTSRTILFKNYHKIDGSLTVSGWVKKTAGTTDKGYRCCCHEAY